MPAAPIADQPRCDVKGCGHYATKRTDGTEEDVQKLGRKALPNLNICDRHTNWPHSDDAQRFILDSPDYKNRGK